METFFFLEFPLFIILQFSSSHAQFFAFKNFINVLNIKHFMRAYFKLEKSCVCELHLYHCTVSAWKQEMKSTIAAVAIARMNTTIEAISPLINPPYCNLVCLVILKTHIKSESIQPNRTGSVFLVPDTNRLVLSKINFTCATVRMKMASQKGK